VKVRKKVLVTSFLNPREVCKREIGKLFLRRWNVELDLRNIKSPALPQQNCYRLG
jgi:hypothetical protein